MQASRCTCSKQTHYTYTTLWPKPVTDIRIPSGVLLIPVLSKMAKKAAKAAAKSKGKKKAMKAMKPMKAMKAMKIYIDYKPCDQWSIIGDR